MVCLHNQVNFFYSLFWSISSWLWCTQTLPFFFFFLNSVCSLFAVYLLNQNYNYPMTFPFSNVKKKRYRQKYTFTYFRTMHWNLRMHWHLYLWHFAFTLNHNYYISECMTVTYEINWKPLYATLFLIIFLRNIFFSQLLSVVQFWMASKMRKYEKEVEIMFQI